MSINEDLIELANSIKKLDSEQLEGLTRTVLANITQSDFLKTYVASLSKKQRLKSFPAIKSEYYYLFQPKCKEGKIVQLE